MSDAPPPPSPEAPERPAPPRPRPRRRRPLWRMVVRDLLLVPLVLAAALAALWHWRAPLIEAVAPWALEAAGFGPAGLRVVALTPERIDLADLALGGDTLTADRLTLDLDVADLMRGRLGPLTVEGLTARAGWSPEGGLDLGPLTPLLAGGESDAPPPVLPVERLTLRDARISIATPWGEMRALGDGAAYPAPGGDGIAGTADLTVSGAGVFAATTLQATLGDAPIISAEIIAQADRRDRPGLARGLQGTAGLGVVWHNGRLDVRADALDLSAEALAPALLNRLPAPLAGLAEGPLSLALTPPDADSPARLSLPLRAEAGATPTLDGRLSVDTARLSLSVDARLQGSGEDGSGWTAPPHGEIDLDLAVGTLPAPAVGMLKDLRARGRLALHQDGRLTWRTEAPLSATLTAPDEALAGVLETILGRSVNGPVTLALGGRDDGASEWTATLRPETGGWTGGWAGVLENAALEINEAGGAAVRVVARIAASISGPPGLQTVSVTATGLAASAEGLAPVGLTGLRAALSSPRLTLADGHLTGPLTLAADADRLEHPTLTAEGPTLAARGILDSPITLDGGLLTLTSATLTADNPQAVGGTWAGPDRLTLTLNPNRPHVVALHRDADAGLGVMLDVVLAPITLGGTITGTAEGLTLAGRLPAADHLPFAARVALPSLRLDTSPLRRAQARLRLTPAGPSLVVSGDVPYLPGEVAPSAGERHPLRPLRVSATLDPDPDDPERFAVAVRIGGPAQPTAARLRGWITRDGQDGRLRLSTPKLALGGKGLQPWHLHGSLVDLSTRAGTLAVQGTIAWRNGARPRPDLTIGLADVDAAYGTTGLRKINGVVRLTGFTPPRSPSNELVAAELDMGLPFTNLVLRFRFDGKGNFVLERASMSLADGDISTGPATISLSGFDSIPLTLEVKGLDLSQLARLTPLDDLTMSGRVDGTVPMIITPGAVRIDAARLGAVAPGVVQYGGEALPEGMQSVDLAKQALRNFEYSDLSMSVDGGTADDMTLNLRLEGANPEVLDGYPFQLNLSVTGPLTRMVQDSLQGYTVPQRIIDNLQKLGLK